MTPIRQLLWRLANRFGGRRLKTWSQNDQYRQGKWHYLAEERRPMVTRLVERLADGGRVLEFGCGEGHLAARVNPDCYQHYVGYDISDIAIANARQRPLSERCQFEVQDINAWPGEAGLTLIIVEECLNYLRPGELAQFLGRCRHSLTGNGLDDRGALLATFHDRTRYQGAIAACKAAFGTHEEILDQSDSLYLILRP
jgi:SAM-dependent methyltransferase